MKRRQNLSIISISLFCAIIIAALYIKFGAPKQVIISSAEQPVPLFAKYSDEPEQSALIAADFTKAASVAVPTVVHIETKAPVRLASGDNSTDNRFRSFGSELNPALRRGSGSGVIISKDGYILTANQVITDRRGNLSEEITVKPKPPRLLAATLTTM
jgi:serine protease Do